MKVRKIFGYWMVVGALSSIGMIVAYFNGAGIDASPTHRITVVLLIGTTILLLRAPIAAAWRFIAQHSPKREPDRYRRDTSARVGANEGPVHDTILQQFANLKFALKDVHGLRWRYRRPWLLLIGDDPTIGQFMPDLVEQGWLITADAVLLWGKENFDGRLDEF
jgi:type VI secretion system protein ImpL